MQQERRRFFKQKMYNKTYFAKLNIFEAKRWINKLYYDKIIMYAFFRR